MCMKKKYTSMSGRSSLQLLCMSKTIKNVKIRRISLFGVLRSIWEVLNDDGN